MLPPPEVRNGPRLKSASIGPIPDLPRRLVLEGQGVQVAPFPLVRVFALGLLELVDRLAQSLEEDLVAPLDRRLVVLLSHQALSGCVDQVAQHFEPAGCRLRASILRADWSSKVSASRCFQKTANSAAGAESIWSW